jgi:hypothetical protein
LSSGVRWNQVSATLIAAMTAPANLKGARSIGLAVWGLAIALLGCMFAMGGRQVLSRWDVISADYALCGVLWIAAGIVMIAGGVWAAISLARHRIFLWIASCATALGGATALVGTVTYVIPCGGPS